MLMITIAIPFLDDIHEERRENINLIKCLAMNTPSNSVTAVTAVKVWFEMIAESIFHE